MSRARLFVEIALFSAPLLAMACATTDGLTETTDADLDATIIPEVCRKVGNPSSCESRGGHLKPRTEAEQVDCMRGIAERRCGEARFLMEKCFDDHPLCYDGAGMPIDDDAGRCLTERTRWEGCRADAGP